jgi:hypothetical protein
MVIAGPCNFLCFATHGHASEWDEWQMTCEAAADVAEWAFTMADRNRIICMPAELRA